jgi:hypothetical protein
MFSLRAKDSAGEAGTRKSPRPGKRSLIARVERSERPVAGNDEAAQADLTGRPSPGRPAVDKRQASDRPSPGRNPDRELPTVPA